VAGFFLGADVHDHISVLDRTVELHTRARVGLGKARSDVVHELELVHRDAQPVDGDEVDGEDAAVEDREVLEQHAIVEGSDDLYNCRSALEDADEAVLGRRREEPIREAGSGLGGRDPEELQR